MGGVTGKGRSGNTKPPMGILSRVIFEAAVGSEACEPIHNVFPLAETISPKNQRVGIALPFFPVFDGFLAI